MKHFVLFIVIFSTCSKKYVTSKLDVDFVAHNDLNIGKLYTPTLYYNVNSIINVLEQPQHLQLKGVKELLNIYYEAENNKTENYVSGDHIRHPFIIIEGLAGSGKRTVVNALSEKINATKIHSQSSKVKKLKNLCKINHIVHAACSQLSRYISALEFDRILKNSPIVLHRFWCSTAASLIARNFFFDTQNNSLPLKGDKVYNWPKDLLKPDLIIFLKCDEEERIRRINKRSETDNVSPGENEFLINNYPGFRKNVLLAYENLDNPAVSYFLNGNLPREEVLEEAYSKVKPLLGLS